MVNDMNDHELPAPARNVLVVEDNHELQNLIVKVLTRSGYKCGCARSGAEALEMLIADPSWVLLLDQKLPDMTGQMVVSALAERGIKAPFVMMTGHGDERLAVEMMRFGASDYLIKDAALLDSLPLALDRTFRAIEVERLLRETEIRLRISERNHRVLLDALPDVIFRFDAEGRHLFASKNVQAMLGLSAADLKGRSHRELAFPEADLMFWERSIKRVLESEQAFEEEYIRESSDLWKMINLRFLPEYGADGRVASVLAVARDVTAHRQTEQDYKLLFEKMLSGFALHEMIYDENGVPFDYRFLAVNPAFEKMTGLDSANIVGRTVRDVLPETEPFWIETYGEVVLTGRPLHFERESKALGKTFSVNAFRPGPRRFACVCLDISERRRMEVERDALQSQLLHTRKMESIGRLASGIAHDFNNMLGVIYGYTELAMDNLDPGSPQHEYLREVHKAAKDSAALTRQLLTFSRKQAYSPVFLDLNEVVQQMMNILKRLIGEGVELVWCPGTSLFPVRADRAQLDQVLANLCVNAGDAVDLNGKVTVSTDNIELDAEFCLTKPDASPGSYVRLCVQDNGCGMDAETLERVFDPFFTTKEETKGTGLGLATVYGVVRQNNGFVSVESDLGAGSSFSVYLPAFQADNASQESGGCSSESARPKDPLGRTVLLVEDEIPMLKTVKIMLESMKCKVLVAATVDDALELARNHQEVIDLLLTDLVIPEMNGKQLHDRILQLRPGIPCLFMSGYAIDKIGRFGISEDACNFLRKPFNCQDLILAVTQAIDNGEAG